MPKAVIAIASDHAGLGLKTFLKQTVAEYASELLDLGTHAQDSVDYPDYGHALAQAIEQGKAHSGIAICGSGIGISIALNRHRGVRAALCHDGLSAALSRRHNDANVLCMGARLIGEDTARDCVRQFFTTVFEGGRHAKRLEKIDQF